MQSSKVKAETLGRKAKLTQSYQELLDEFSNKDLKSVGNYTLGRLIGKGSFGKVYLATHKLTNGSKVVLKSANKDDSNLAREIHHHRQFVHPHIARLYEVIVTESLVWLVLEYCPGDELYNYLLKHGKLPVDKVQKTFTQLVGAVCYVHQQSCVHRDLKLENILLDKHENVKLCDFGFTREYEGKANYLQTFCGTICYSAPEMLKGEKYAGEKVDVWSLGVILYALLCGELPFDDDDDSVTRTKILTLEPNYPDHIPPDALSLLKSLLSKRPLLRPTLPDILAHPFLAEYAPQQQEILKVERPEPFSTPLEKETLHRMRSAGVDIDSVIESVLAQRCDVLAGWWTLLIEKEERKQKRRERKRKEKELENRTSRRFSQASSRLNALATVEEAQLAHSSDPPPPRTRGRSERRSGYFPSLAIPDMPDLSDLAKVANGNLSPESEAPPPPIDKDSIRSVSSSRHRKPIPPPKEGVLRSARSRGSTLHLVTTSDALGANGASQGDPKKVKKRPSHAIMATWKNWTHWLFENTAGRRHKNSNKRGSQSTPNLVSSKPASGKEGKSQANSPRPQTSKYPASSSRAAPQTASLPKGVVANGYTARGGPSSAAALSSHPPLSPGLITPPIPSSNHAPRLHTSGSSYKRHSLSPSPLTPRSTVRRSSGQMTGLRGRKSTSSSVSSVRSLHHTTHHTHSHSKASSTSSNGSVSTSVASKTPMQSTRSPHHSVKVLPATPTAGTFPGFPSNIRLVRDRAGPPLSIFNTEGLAGVGVMGSGSVGGHGGYAYRHGGGISPVIAAPGSPNPFFASSGHGNGNGNGNGGGVVFAKRKRNLFKGPMLSLSGHHFGGFHHHHGSREGKSGVGKGGGGGIGGVAGSGSSGSHSRSASASGLGAGRRSGEMAIQEEDEDEEAEVEAEAAAAATAGTKTGTGTGAGVFAMGDVGEEGEGEEEVEEVEAFSPIVKRPGEIVEENIYEEGEEEAEEVAGLQPPVEIRAATAVAGKAES
ncbi:kinase-like protein [Parathielavia appendiculata]|uniref:Kinase-like protein n=1 Tax=Parathielavia appendiculata TaxID=2587402 RepID=A0AAN6Z4X6_9PEZI|nr:kinase-like protein [Parathielavia appendiculata]